MAPTSPIIVAKSFDPGPDPLQLGASLSIPKTTLITRMPQLGLGTYLSPPELTIQSCLAALQAGYRHIDTAQFYQNEEQVGEAIRKSGIARENVFVTTKILTPGETLEATYNKCIESIEKIHGKFGYVDCLLIHSTGVGKAKRKQMWLALERLYLEGKARAIGTSNFGKVHIEELKGIGKVWPPHVNQIELHPWHQQREIVQYCHENGIVVQAYCPIARNQHAGDPTVQAIAEKHGVTPNQVLIRWSLQKGWIALPKSDDPDRIRQNGDVFGFELSTDDVELLDGLDQGAAGALVQTVTND
ncbi:alcohol dehydrogenase [Diaporthe helianthi]|uniref:Alcohol dehydrogenase n=1 Tax=Diaporthe helianthi TaxID=158607 RepID=A0A2P5I3M3_DIAHE|nr:alcohol dehydrogenase [Diaporthe helianthi]